MADSGGKTAYRVLVVEDNPHVSEIFRYAFRRIVNEQLGDDVEVQVDGVADGASAWESLEASATGVHFDLVILDLMLPIMDGAEVLQRVRAHEGLKDLRVLVITAGDDEAVKGARELGANEVLRKPVQFAEIRDVVARLL